MRRRKKRRKIEHNRKVLKRKKKKNHFVVFSFSVTSKGYSHLIMLFRRNYIVPKFI